MMLIMELVVEILKAIYVAILNAQILITDLKPVVLILILIIFALKHKSKLITWLKEIVAHSVQMIWCNYTIVTLIITIVKLIVIHCQCVLLLLMVANNYVTIHVETQNSLTIVVQIIYVGRPGQKFKIWSIIVKLLQ